MSVDPFKSGPHGPYVVDAIAPSGAAGEAVFVGYPDTTLVVSGTGGTVVEATNDVEQVGGAYQPAAGATWISLGVIPANALALRLGRVRYAFLRGSGGDITVHTADVTDKDEGVAVSPLIAPMPIDTDEPSDTHDCDDPPDSSWTKAAIRQWLEDGGTTGVSALSKSELLDLAADLCD